MSTNGWGAFKKSTFSNTGKGCSSPKTVDSVHFNAICAACLLLFRQNECDWSVEPKLIKEIELILKIQLRITNI